MAKEYNLKTVVCTINGVPIRGFSDGDAVMVATDDDIYSKQVGADGEVARSNKGNKGGTITFRLMYTADSNAYMQAWKTLDNVSANGVARIAILDMNGATSVLALEAWIKKDPNLTFSEESGTREWIWDFDKELRPQLSKVIAQVLNGL